MHADSRNDVGLSLLVGFDAVAEIMTFTLRLTLTERRTYRKAPITVWY